jgi:hypothetical protein
MGRSAGPQAAHRGDAIMARKETVASAYPGRAVSPGCRGWCGTGAGYDWRKVEAKLNDLPQFDEHRRRGHSFIRVRSVRRTRSR